MENSNEKIEMMQEILKDIDISFFDHEMVRDNKAYFDVANVSYRCRMPNQREAKDANLKQQKKFYDLIQIPGEKTKERMKKELLEKGDINVQQMEEERQDFKEKLQSKYLDLALIPTEDEVAIEKLRAEIEEIKYNFIKLHVKIGEYFASSIETQVETYYMEYLTYLCTEKSLGDDKWEKVWKSLEEFDNASLTLTNTAVKNIARLISDLNK